MIINSCLTNKKIKRAIFIFLSINTLASIVLTSNIVVAKQKNIDVEPIKKKMLGQWAFVEAGKLVGGIEFIDKEYALIMPKILEIDSYSQTKITLARWSIKDGYVLNPREKGKRKGEISVYSPLLKIDFQFINQSPHRDHHPLFDKTQTRFFTLPKGNVSALMPQAMIWSVLTGGKEIVTVYPKPKKASAKPTRMVKLNKLKPKLQLEWKRLIKRALLISSTTGQFSSHFLVKNKCKYWKSIQPDYKECKKMLKIFSEHPGHNYKTDNFDRLAVPVSKFLLTPVTNFSDTTELPATLSETIYTCSEKTGVDKFKDTYWTLKVRPHVMEPDKYTDQKAKGFYKALIIWSNLRWTGSGNSYTHNRSQIVHLRDDGVLGLSWDKDDHVIKHINQLILQRGKNHTMVYDPANRWDYDGKDIILKWQNGSTEYRFNRQNKYRHRARYEWANIQPINTHRGLLNELMHQHYSPAYFKPRRLKEPAYIKLVKKVEEESRLGLPKCPGISQSSQIAQPEKPAPRQHAKIPKPREPKVVKPKISKSKIYIPGSYWFGRIVPINDEVPVDPTLKKLWGKGAYLHLRKDGQMGYNWSTPNGYLYDPTHKWKNNGSKLTLIFGVISYTFDINPGKRTLTTHSNNVPIYRMTMQARSKGQK